MKVQTPEQDTKKPIHVLLAEDEILVLMELASGLRDAGCNVLEAYSYTQARDLLEIPPIPPIDIVVTDMRMETADAGVRLATFVRQTRPMLPIVLVSGHVRSNAFEHAQHLFDAVLEKPVLIEHAAALIRSMAASGPPKSAC